MSENKSVTETSTASPLTITHTVFDEISFRRKGFKTESKEVSVEYSSAEKKMSDCHYNVMLKITVNKEEEYQAVVRMTAYCEIEESAPRKAEILQENVPAILLPYARAQLTMLTAQPETDAIVLPVMNVHAIVQSATNQEPKPE